MTETGGWRRDETREVPPEGEGLPGEDQTRARGRCGNVPAGDGENQIQEAVTEEEIRSVRNEQEETAPPSPWAVASNFVFILFASLFPETQQVA